MTKRVARLGLSLLALLILPLTLALFAFALPAQYTETFMGGFSDKLDALRSAPGRRIILAGGSGAAFAVRSDLLEGELPGYSVVNLGMYAGLGSTAPLDAAASDLREGDIVVFLPEQNEQTLSMYFGSEAMWQATDGHWELLSVVRKDNWRAMLGQFPYFAAQKARCFFQGVRPQGDGVYTRGAFNRWGDIESALRASNVMPDGYDPNAAVSFSPDLPSQDFIDYVNAYAALCAGRGASFCFGFCPMNVAAIDDLNAERIAGYERRLSDALICPLLGHAQDSVMDERWFFDTNFHLNSAGAIVYTAQLALHLKHMLGLPEQVSISLPEQPDTPQTGETFGDDTDADCFQYAQTAGGWRICGLTREGAQRRRLTLPTHYQGAPVTGLDASVFVQNTVIEELTVQPNIHALYDGSFDGCTHLNSLILRGVSPSECPVGDGLLRGTAAFVYVDADLLAAYQTNYFWAVHASRISVFTDSNARPSDSPDRADATQKPEALQQLDPAEPFIRYDANGGYLLDTPNETARTAPIDDTHLRMNTLTAIFTRPGYIQIGWNTERDGSGTSVGLGSRVFAESGMTLYAQWAAESPAEDFTWRIENDAVLITGYHGFQEPCVIPASIDGMPVRVVCEGAFVDSTFETLVLAPTLTSVEPGAFSGCALQTLYLYDTLESISDSSFEGCNRLTTLHVNAATPPVYSISYYATFADKYDWLVSLSGRRKLVLFSGSSTRYGYDSAMLHRAYPAYEVANMGVYAYTNALPQMELILLGMESGDVLLHAPEFDTLHNQTCEENTLDFHFWAMMEANYDCVSLLPMTAYTQIFDSLQKYLTIRRDLPARSYADSPNGYDDDGQNHHEPTYNPYGDLIIPRANTKIDMMLQHVRAAYTPEPFTAGRIAAMNCEYQRFIDKGIQVLFTYTPRNRSSLTEDSTAENRSALDKLLREQLLAPVISDMEDSLMSGIYFYVIDSHLSSEGVRLHTSQVIEDLAAWLSTE